MLGPEEPEVGAAGGEGVRRVAGYQLGRELGRGGSGVVYEAKREGSGAVVALKLLRVQGVDADRAPRTWRELEVLKRVRLPGVPRVLDWGEDGGQAYIVSELVHGASLDRACASLTREQSVELIARVADIVQELHERQVIHRDLKPSNILVTPTGTPVVLDFGLASVLEGRTETTMTWGSGQLGTPAFMAPEQAQIDGRATTRTDVYGLGATAVYVLTGKFRFRQGETPMQTLREVATGVPNPVRVLDPTLPLPLAAVLEKATAPQPSGRYESAAQFARDLRRWAAGEPVSAVPPGRWQRLVQRIGRHPVAATVLVCLAILGGTLLGTWGYLQWWWWKNQTPSEVFFREFGTSIQVVARSGRAVREIPIEAGSVRQAQLLSQSDTGGSPLVAVALYQDDVASEIDVLRLYDARTGELVGRWRPTPPDWYVNRAPDDPAYGPYFRCWKFDVMDVFPDHPGQEIVAVYHHNRSSLTAIAVHNLKGEVLFSVWHDGFVYDFGRVGDTDVLVFTGVNSDGEWRDRGVVDTRSAVNPHPTIAMAIRPQLGSREGVIIPGHGLHSFDPLWYRCLQPTDIALNYCFNPNGPRMIRRGPEINGQPSVAVWVTQMNDEGVLHNRNNVEWYVTAQGAFHAIPLESFHVQWLATNPKAPHPGGLRWDPLPPHAADRR